MLLADGKLLHQAHVCCMNVLVTEMGPVTIIPISWTFGNGIYCRCCEHKAVQSAFVLICVGLGLGLYRC